MYHLLQDTSDNTYLITSEEEESGMYEQTIKECLSAGYSTKGIVYTVVDGKPLWKDSLEVPRVRDDVRVKLIHSFNKKPTIEYVKTNHPELLI